jgi:hypothetical protein
METAPCWVRKNPIARSLPSVPTGFCRSAHIWAGRKLGRMMLPHTLLADGILRRAPYDSMGQCPRTLWCSLSATSAPYDISPSRCAGRPVQKLSQQYHGKRAARSRRKEACTTLRSSSWIRLSQAGRMSPNRAWPVNSYRSGPPHLLHSLSCLLAPSRRSRLCCGFGPTSCAL